MNGTRTKVPAINHIWLFMMTVPVIVALATGRMEAVTKAGFEAASSAVELSLKLIGVMTLWLGLMKVAESGGLTAAISRAIRPLMVRLFPDVPPDHPAMGAMIMNIAANMMGLGNAATPPGIKAMMELDRLNPTAADPRGRQATNAMCMFMAINTSSVTIFPISVIAMRAAAGSTNPAAVFIPGLLATVCSTLTAIAVGFLFNRFRPNPVFTAAGASPVCAAGCAESDSADLRLSETSLPEATEVRRRPGAVLLPALFVLAAAAAVIYRIAHAGTSGIVSDAVRWWTVPILMTFIVVYAHSKGAAVYESACDGGKEGFQAAVRIIPFLVMIMVAVGMLRASGAFDMAVSLLDPLTATLGVPSEVLPAALLRPLTGSGAFAVVSDLTIASPDGFSAYLAGIMQGSTETTFYVLAVYFGSVGITRIRHALYPALMADLAGLSSSVVFAHIFF